MYNTSTRTKEKSLETKLKGNLIRISEKSKILRKHKDEKITIPTKSKFALNVASSKGSSSIAINLCTPRSVIPCKIKRSISCPSFDSEKLLNNTENKSSSIDKLPRKAFYTSWNPVENTSSPCSTVGEFSKQFVTKNRKQTVRVSTLMEQPKDHGDRYELNSKGIRQMMPLQKRVQGDSNKLKARNRMITSTRKASTVNDFVSYQSTSQKGSVTSGSSHGTSDVYRHFLGPTPDETIMAGLQTFLDMCRGRCSSSTSNRTDDDGLTASSDYCTKTEDDYLMDELLIDTMVNRNNKPLQSGDNSLQKNNSVLQLKVRRNEQCLFCNEYPNHYQPACIVEDEEYCTCNYDPYIRRNNLSDKAVLAHDNNIRNINTRPIKGKLLFDNGCQVHNSKEEKDTIFVKKTNKPHSSVQTIDVPISAQGVQTEAKYEEEVNMIVDPNRPPYRYSIGGIDSHLFYKPEHGDITENIYQTFTGYECSQQGNSISKLDYKQSEKNPKTKPSHHKTANTPSAIVEKTERKPLQFAFFLHEPYNGDNTKEYNNDTNVLNNLSSPSVFGSDCKKYKDECQAMNSFEQGEGHLITVTEKNSTTSEEQPSSINRCKCLDMVEKLYSSQTHCKVDEPKFVNEEIVIGFHTIFEETCPTSSGEQRNNSFHISFPKGNLPSKIHLTAKMCVNHNEDWGSSKVNQKPEDVFSIPEELQERLHSNECASSQQLEIEFDPIPKEELQMDPNPYSQSKLTLGPNLSNSKDFTNFEYQNESLSGLNLETSESPSKEINLIHCEKNSSKSNQRSHIFQVAIDSKFQPPVERYGRQPEVSHHEHQINMDNTPSQPKNPISGDHRDHSRVETEEIPSKLLAKVQEVKNKNFQQTESSKNCDGSCCTCSRNFKHANKGCQCESYIENVSERDMSKREFEDAKFIGDSTNVGEDLCSSKIKINHDEYYQKPTKDSIFQKNYPEMVRDNFCNTSNTKICQERAKTETSINDGSLLSRNNTTQSEGIQTEAKECSSTESGNEKRSIGLQMESHTSNHKQRKRSNFYKQVLQTFETDLVLGKDSFGPQSFKPINSQTLKPRSYYNVKDTGTNSVKNIPKSRSYQGDLLLTPNEIHNPYIENVMVMSECYKRSQKSIRSKKSIALNKNKIARELQRGVSQEHLYIIDKDVIKSAEELKTLAERVKNSSSQKKVKKKGGFKVSSSCLDGALTEVCKVPQKAAPKKNFNEKRPFTCAPAMISSCDCQDESTRDSDGASYEENHPYDDINVLEPRAAKRKENSDNILCMKSKPTASYFAKVNEKGFFDIGDNKCKRGNPDIDYAFVRISKFDEYTVFEILKSTKVKPLWLHLPSTVEDIFVIKNTDKKC